MDHCYDCGGCWPTRLFLYQKEKIRIMNRERKRISRVEALEILNLPLDRNGKPVEEVVKLVQHRNLQKGALEECGDCRFITIGLNEKHGLAIGCLTGGNPIGIYEGKTYWHKGGCPNSSSNGKH